MFGLIKDIRFGVDIECCVRQPQTGRDLSDSHHWSRSFIGDTQRLFTEFAAERNSILVEDIAQTLCHSESAAEKDHLAALGKRITDGLAHFLDAPVELRSRLTLDVEDGVGHFCSAKLLED